MSRRLLFCCEHSASATVAVLVYSNRDVASWKHSSFSSSTGKSCWNTTPNPVRIPGLEKEAPPCSSGTPLKWR